MSEIVKFEDLQDRIIELRGQKGLLDADVAQIYGVETRDINKAVSNNPDKFPAGYVVELSKAEKNKLVENFHRFNRLKHSTVNPKAFPEKGLYMLATILKSPQAVQATLAIIETFSKMRKLSRNIKTLSNVKDKREQQGLNSKMEGLFVVPVVTKRASLAGRKKSVKREMKEFWEAESLLETSWLIQRKSRDIKKTF